MLKVNIRLNYNCYLIYPEQGIQINLPRTADIGQQAHSCHTNSLTKLKSLFGELCNLTMFFSEIWHWLLPKALMQSPKKFFRSSHYSIYSKFL